MSEYDGCIPVVAVRIDKTLQTIYRMCIVPYGVFVDEGDTIFFGAECSDYSEKGVCVSDTMFLTNDVLKMVCRVTGSNFDKMLTVKAKVNIEWFDQRKEDAIEQAVLWRIRQPCYALLYPSPCHKHVISGTETD